MVHMLRSSDWRRQAMLWQRLMSVVLIVVLLLPVTGGVAAHGEDDLLRVIVQRAQGGPAAEAITRALGGQVLMDLHLINSFVAMVPRQSVAQLAAHPSVRWVSVDGPLARHGHQNDSPIDPALLSVTYDLSVKADTAWQMGNWGQGVTVAVVDSGIEVKTAKGKVKSDFGDGKGRRVRARVSMIEDSAKSKDRFGHGTAVAGIIGGDGAISGGKYVGVAPSVNLVSVKVGGDDGTGYESDLVAGLQWIYDHRDKLGVRVINLSVTAATPQSYHTSPLDAAVEVMWFNGFVVVVAAGNDINASQGAILYPPANDPFVITVGAANEMGTADLGDDVMAPWSIWGVDEAMRPKPDLVAPGVGLITTLAPGSFFATQYPARVVDGTYIRFGGTSAAAAVVSGAAALLLTQEPNLTPDQVKYRLGFTANRSWPGMDPSRAGNGYLDVSQALAVPTFESANVGVPISRFLTPPDTDVVWDGVQWGGVQWGGVQWGGVQWGGVQWGGVQWGGVQWGGVSWEE